MKRGQKLGVTVGAFLTIRQQAKLYGISPATMGVDRLAGCPPTEEEGKLWRIINRRAYRRLNVVDEPGEISETQRLIFEAVYGPHA